MSQPKASCLHTTCDCIPDGDRAFCSDHCETEHVDDVIEVEACRCGHEGCGDAAGDR
ncbi:MAG: hypothetical protein ACQGVC_10910 [Myxococcota bacterium]